MHKKFFMNGGDEVYDEPSYKTREIHSLMVLCNNAKLNQRAVDINTDRTCGKKFLASDQ